MAAVLTTLERRSTTSRYWISCSTGCRSTDSILGSNWWGTHLTSFVTSTMTHKSRCGDIWWGRWLAGTLVGWKRIQWDIIRDRETGYGLDDRGSVSVTGRNFYLPHNFHENTHIHLVLKYKKHKTSLDVIITWFLGKGTNLFLHFKNLSIRLKYTWRVLCYHGNDTL